MAISFVSQDSSRAIGVDPVVESRSREELVAAPDVGEDVRVGLSLGPLLDPLGPPSVVAVGAVLDLRVVPE